MTLTPYRVRRDDGEAYTASEWEAIRLAPVKDKTYQAFPIGDAVRRFMDYFRLEFGATQDSQRDYESILAKLALFYPSRGLGELDVPEGTELLKDFMAHHWSDAAPRTKKKVKSVLVSFCDWAVDERLLIANPARGIRIPKQRGVERDVFPKRDREKLVASQSLKRDRIAVSLLFACALRKSELAAIQFKHFDFGRRRLRVFGKGGTVETQVIPRSLLDEIERYALDRHPDEFLLYPQKKTGAAWNRDYAGVIWEDRFAPLSKVTMHRWFKGCLERADLPATYTMHQARHTAITEVVRKSGSLAVAQKFARHVDGSTTLNIYTHLNDMDVERVVEELWK